MMVRSPARTIGSGDAFSEAKLTESAMPVVTTDQFVVMSRRCRHTVERKTSAR